MGFRSPRRARPSARQSAYLPVEEVTPDSEPWRIVWQLWTKYFQLLPASIYEGGLASSRSVARHQRTNPACASVPDTTPPTRRIRTTRDER